MAKGLTTTRASVTVYDLTDTSIRAQSQQVATLNNLGFTFIRNDIDFTNEVGSSRVAIDANAGSSSVGVANIFTVLNIPEGAIVHELFLAVPAGATAGPSVNDGGAVGANALLNFGAATVKSASGTTTKYDIDAFGTMAADASTNAVANLPTVSASTPWTRVAGYAAFTKSSATMPVYFPYGGAVEIQFSGGSNTSAVSTDVYFSGELSVVAICSKMPE